MKNKLIISLTLLALIITACGGQATQTPPEPAAPTQAVTQPTPVPTIDKSLQQIQPLQQQKCCTRNRSFRCSRCQFCK